MSLATELKDEVATIFRKAWSTRDGNKVPEPEDLQLGNDAVKLDSTVLYADLADSTDLVQNNSAEFAAEVYKTYLHCASKIIRAEGGEITAFDGDRVMAVFLGGSKNTSAVRCALKINYAVIHIINPAIKAQYPTKSYSVRQVVGIDTSQLFIARTGIRGSNDLVWVGRAANYAAKLSSLPSFYSTYISDTIFENTDVSVRVSNGTPMWAREFWSERSLFIYKSNYWWTID